MKLLVILATLTAMLSGCCGSASMHLEGGWYTPSYKPTEQM